MSTEKTKLSKQEYGFQLGGLYNKLLMCRTACVSSFLAATNTMLLGFNDVEKWEEYEKYEKPFLKKDVFEVINMGWDMMIAHPPCTHLAVSGARHFEKKRADGRQQQGIDFFMGFTKTNIPKVCIENPMGIMSTIYKKPTQIIQPYYFGDEVSKRTSLA